MAHVQTYIPPALAQKVKEAIQRGDRFIDLLVLNDNDGKVSEATFAVDRISSLWATRDEFTTEVLPFYIGEYRNAHLVREDRGGWHNFYGRLLNENGRYVLRYVDYAWLLPWDRVVGLAGATEETTKDWIRDFEHLNVEPVNYRYRVAFPSRGNALSSAALVEEILKHRSAIVCGDYASADAAARAILHSVVPKRKVLVVAPFGVTSSDINLLSGFIDASAMNLVDEMRKTPEKRGTAIALTEGVFLTDAVGAARSLRAGVADLLLDLDAGRQWVVDDEIRVPDTLCTIGLWRGDSPNYRPLGEWPFRASSTIPKFPVDVAFCR